MSALIERPRPSGMTQSSSGITPPQRLPSRSIRRWSARLPCPSPQEAAELVSRLIPSLARPGDRFPDTRPR